jgi:hypothetical protein
MSKTARNLRNRRRMQKIAKQLKLIAKAKKKERNKAK